MNVRRRSVLRGLGGLAISLPFLESQMRSARAQAETSASRFFVVFSHGGTISATKKNGTKYDGEGDNNGVDGWAPAPGEALEVGAIHQPLQNHVDSLLVLQGIDNKPCIEQTQYAGGHRWSNVTVLTAAELEGEEEEDAIALGPSIDATLAQRLAERNPVAFPSIYLGVPAHNYGSPFFEAARQRISSEGDPQAAFDKLFAGMDTGDPEADNAAQRARLQRQSVLDGVEDGLSLFRQRVSVPDREMIDAHLTHIRELEQQIAALAQSVGCQPPSLEGVDRNVDLDVIGPAQVDIMLAAVRCGLTNVAALEIGDLYAQFLDPTFPAAFDIGHSLDHSAGDVGKTGVDAANWQDWYDTMLSNRRWRMSLLARLLDGLKATPEGEGNMLDNSVLLYTSEFSCGADHAVVDLPILLAGGAGGQWRTGRHLNYNLAASSDATTREYETQTSLQNLYTSVLHAFGYDDANFGHDEYLWTKGPLSGLS